MFVSSIHHYPQIVFEGDEKLLWNPVLKKAYKNLPEERVRLAFVDYLIEESSFSKARISFESPVDLPRDKSKSRTDLICYDKEFKPLLLVECKAPDVRLDAKVALQIARYNQQIDAPLLLVTNGLTAYWFKSKNETIAFLNDVPVSFQSSGTIERFFDYWAKRGFVGKNTNPEIRNWITENCRDLFNENNSNCQFLNFNDTSPELGLSNYYNIFEINKNIRLALSFTSTSFGTTKLNVVLNNNGENVALLSVSLDLITSEKQRNTILQTERGIEYLDLKSEIGFGFEKPLDVSLKAISDLML